MKSDSTGFVTCPGSNLPVWAAARPGDYIRPSLSGKLPDLLPKTIAGLTALSRNGLRYPIPPYGVNNDVRAGMGVSYPQTG